MTALAGYPASQADAVRAHVRQLRDHGASYEAIGNAAGAGAMTVHDLMNGGGQVTDRTARALLAVTTEQIELRRVDRKSTRLNSSHSLPSRMPSSA